MVLEWVPSRKNLEIYDHEPKELSDVEFSSLLKTFNLFDREKLGAFTEKNLASVIRASIGFKAELNDIKKLLSDFGSNDEMNFEQFVAFLRSGRFREEQKNRKFVALSLAEAETIRRIMHVRMEKEIISGSDASMCLRCVPAENHVIDQSYRFSPAPANQVEVENQCFRFLDCDMYYTDSQVGVLVKSLQSTRERDRRIFFERVMGCRRRMRRKWEETPVSKVFTTSDEWKLLKQKALMQSIREVISEKGILFYDAFRMFDYNRDGLLSASELYGSIEWLGFDLDPLDVIEFMRTNDIDKDGNLNYREFLEIVRDPDANFDDIEKEHESSESSGKFGEFQRIEPKAVQEILQLEMQLAEEEKKIEEEELKNEKDKEAEIMMKIEAEEIEQDLMQQGGPNPKIDYDIGNVKYDFTTGRRPRGLTSRGDFAFQNSFGDKFTLVHVGGMLFVLIPFSSEKSPLNEYTITMDISFDSLPESGQIALIQTAKYNQDTSAFYVRSDGQVGVPGHYSMESNVPKIQPKRWYVVSVSVNLHENMVLIYVDGQLCSFFSSEDLVPNGKYSVSDQLCLFGSKTVSENLGGQIKSLLFDTRSRDQFEIQAIFEMINAEGAWICEGCTYNNSRHSKHCELCSKQKFVFDADLSWACPVCTFINTSGEMCSVCETPKP
jgi:Ca2+-binding EF-hand superfamily protein